MKRTWPIVGVADVQKSAAWYMRLLNAQNSHADATSFDQIIDRDGTILVCLHRWGDHGHPSLSNPEDGNLWERVQAIGSVIEERPNTNNGTGMRAFTLRDLDGYYVTVNEQRH
jgi:hypothetical protein